MSTPECLDLSDVDSVLHAVFYCPKTPQKFIKQVEPIFNKHFGDNFKSNGYIIGFAITYKIGNNASKL